MIPQSMTLDERADPLPCSMTMQFRPISPRPPSRTTLTGSATSRHQARVDRSRLVLEPGRALAEREAALPDGNAECSQHGLRRDRVRRVVAGLECEALEHPAVDPAGVVVHLYAKGKARKDTTGFVVKTGRY